MVSTLKWALLQFASIHRTCLRLDHKRYMRYDYKKSGFTDKNELNGPLLQTGMNF
jgi:hypothetical protein